MRLGRRLSTGIAEDPPTPGGEPAQPATAEQAETVEPEVRREYAEAAER